MKDRIENIFENLEGSFDVHETPSGHQGRFLSKLNNTAKAKPKKLNWWKPLSIAASIAVLVTIGFSLNPQEEVTGDLASISPEMEKTQDFFTKAINQELKTLKSFENAETKALIDDAISQLSVLEKEYDKLKIDLVNSGNNKQVIYGMITNFQQRIDLLEQVTTTLEEIQTLKANKNETLI